VNELFETFEEPCRVRCNHKKGPPTRIWLPHLCLARQARSQNAKNRSAYSCVSVSRKMLTCRGFSDHWSVENGVVRVGWGELL